VRLHAQLLFALTVGMPLLLPAGGAAASTICERLQGELSGLPRVMADTASVRKYAGAITRQNIQLRKAKSDMRRLGCGGGSLTIIGGANGEMCQTLTSVVGKMERNLQILDKKRREFAAGTSTTVTRRRLVAALDANGCNGAGGKILSAATTEELRPIRKERTATLPLDAVPEGNDRFQLRALGGASGHGNLRTVCVRTCDGGFFPISGGATPLDFRRDQKVCAMMCPKTETELYYHSLNGQQETSQMVSTQTGRPYAELPAAFAYRTRDLSKTDTCGCNLSAYYQEMIRREKALSGEEMPPGKSAAAGTEKANTGSITTITSRPVEDVAIKEKPVAEERVYDPANSKIRTIGPAFLPENESAIDLRNPAQSGVN
jgi:hypothetical protein